MAPSRRAALELAAARCGAVVSCAGLLPSGIGCESAAGLTVGAQPVRCCKAALCGLRWPEQQRAVARRVGPALSMPGGLKGARCRGRSASPQLQSPTLGLRRCHREVLRCRCHQRDHAQCGSRCVRRMGIVIPGAWKHWQSKRLGMLWRRSGRVWTDIHLGTYQKSMPFRRWTKDFSDWRKCMQMKSHALTFAWNSERRHLPGRSESSWNAWRSVRTSSRGTCCLSWHLCKCRHRILCSLHCLDLGLCPEDCSPSAVA